MFLGGRLYTVRLVHASAGSQSVPVKGKAAGGPYLPSFGKCGASDPAFKIRSDLRAQRSPWPCVSPPTSRLFLPYGKSPPVFRLGVHPSGWWPGYQN